ncbi:MAG TPA: hypothetical protein GXX14_14250 [Clostridiaceae bacterium]|nr:hypothetical protein [Clostridiaceae bacterium]
MDVFMEKIVARKKGPKDFLFSVGVILAGLIIAFITLQIPILNSFFVLILVGVIYGIYYLITSRNIEFEYIVTNGYLDIDKIIARRKRKRIFSADCKDFDIVAKFNRFGSGSNVLQNSQKTIEAVSSMESNGIYYITLNYKGEKTTVLFEPDERMLKSFKSIIPRKVEI